MNDLVQALGHLQNTATQNERHHKFHGQLAIRASWFSNFFSEHLCAYVQQRLCYGCPALHRCRQLAMPGCAVGHGFAGSGDSLDKVDLKICRKALTRIPCGHLWSLTCIQESKSDVPWIGQFFRGAWLEEFRVPPNLRQVGRGTESYGILQPSTIPGLLVAPNLWGPRLQ